MNKRVNNKSTGRDYSYDKKYQSSPSQIKKRSQRNKARREVFNTLKEKIGESAAKKKMDGMDVDHKKPIKSGGTNKKSNLRLLTPHKNRGLK